MSKSEQLEQVKLEVKKIQQATRDIRSLLNGLDRNLDALERAVLDLKTELDIFEQE